MVSWMAHYWELKKVENWDSTMETNSELVMENWMAHSWDKTTVTNSVPTTEEKTEIHSEWTMGNCSGS